MLKPDVTLYFVRHGETDWNLTQRYQGWRDIPLNATGRAQAARNGRRLAEVIGKDAAIYDYRASPLKRARETMEIVRRELGLEPEDYRADDRLLELHYGHWEGLLWSELPTLDPDGFAARKLDAWGWQPRGGESYRMLSERVARWVSEIERSTVVAAHGGVSRVLRGLVLGLPGVEVPTLPVPQDRVLVVRASGIEWL
jgi:probable phosphoglycerate mutase